jgi:hypothetical protein
LWVYFLRPKPKFDVFELLLDRGAKLNAENILIKYGRKISLKLKL